MQDKSFGCRVRISRWQYQTLNGYFNKNIHQNQRQFVLK